MTTGNSASYKQEIQNNLTYVEVGHEHPDQEMGKLSQKSINKRYQGLSDGMLEDN
jgi:hypothetical protein